MIIVGISGVVFLFLILIRISVKQTRALKKATSLIIANKEQIKKLEIEKKTLELNALKNSLQPHTLRNVIAHMKALSNKLNSGWDSLSVSLEYIFSNGHNHFVTVQEEVDFVQNYLKLNELFFTGDESIQLKINTTENAHSLIIPHLITVYYLENAFKHGDKFHRDFLQVNITTESSFFQIEVINKIRPIQSIIKKPGIGLDNMQKRLEALIPNKYHTEINCTVDEYRALLKIHL